VQYIHLQLRRTAARKATTAIRSLHQSHSCTSLYPLISRVQNSQHIATSIVHSKLDYCNSLYHNLTGSNRSRTLLLVLLLRLLNPDISLQSLHWLKVNERIEYKLLYLTYKVLTTSQQSDLCSTPSQYPLLIGCHPFSPTNHLLIENHRSLIQICITPSLESTP